MEQNVKDILKEIKFAHAPYRMPRRKHWYRMDERLESRTPVDKSLVGKQVKVSRVIVRSGYYIEHMDIGSGFSFSETSKFDELVNTIMANDLHDASRGKISFEDASNAVDALYESWGYGIRSRAKYKARSLMLNALYRLDEYKQYHRQRTFWYVSLADVNTPQAWNGETENKDSEQWFNIVKTNRHVLGTQYDAQGGVIYTMDGADYDYEPGGLSPAYFQSVYSAKKSDISSNDPGVWARNYDDYSDSMVEIHPLDILEVREKNG